MIGGMDMGSYFNGNEYIKKKLQNLDRNDFIAVNDLVNKIVFDLINPDLLDFDNDTTKNFES